MTKREMYNELIALAKANGRDDLVNGLNHEIDLLDKKNKAPKGPTSRQLENDHIKAYVVNHIGANSYTITNMIKALDLESKWPEITVSRLTAICTKLIDEGVLTKEIIKRQSLYRKA